MAGDDEAHLSAELWTASRPKFFAGHRARIRVPDVEGNYTEGNSLFQGMSAHFEVRDAMPLLRSLVLGLHRGEST